MLDVNQSYTAMKPLKAVIVSARVHPGESLGLKTFRHWWNNQSFNQTRHFRHLGHFMPFHAISIQPNIEPFSQGNASWLVHGLIGFLLSSTAEGSGANKLTQFDVDEFWYDCGYQWLWCILMIIIYYTWTMLHIVLSFEMASVTPMPTLATLTWLQVLRDNFVKGSEDFGGFCKPWLLSNPINPFEYWHFQHFKVERTH